MSEDAAPTLWLQQLQQGDRLAAQRLWEAYFGKLVTLARQKLMGRELPMGDEEDAALSAFKSFCRGVASRRFPDLNDRDDLWKLLVTITLRKVMHMKRDEASQKRGGQWKQIDAVGDSETAAIEQLMGHEPTPELAAEMVEQYDRLLKQLSAPDLVELATLKMEGYTNEGIAEKWGKTARTVERKLRLIRKIWEQEV
jgi:DNA-directed RNA polymerase specialized sigma24 family protein